MLIVFNLNRTHIVFLKLAIVFNTFFVENGCLFRSKSDSHASDGYVGCSTQKKVALDLGFNISTIQRWWVKFKSGETLQHR